MGGQWMRFSREKRPELDAFLADRLYESNAAATRIDDGALPNASVEDEAGRTIAGISGHMWSGCCEISVLWVIESSWGKGISASLMRAAEREAVRRGCRRMVLWAHSFQAPGFYERLGFPEAGLDTCYPLGHEKAVYVKSLPPRPAHPGERAGPGSDRGLCVIGWRTGAAMAWYLRGE